MKILFFDTETTGLPKNWKAPVEEIDNWPRLVQIAWQVYDQDKNLIEEHEYIIKPDGFSIPLDATEVHKITTQKASEIGENINKVLSSFYQSVDDTDILVAHNYSYDYSVVGSELLRNEYENILKSKDHICTMLSSTDFCKIPGPYGFKWPKLEELYSILFVESFNAHNALDDIRATSRCFWKLVKLKEIAIPEIKLEKQNQILKNKIGNLEIKIKKLEYDANLVYNECRQELIDFDKIVSKITRNSNPNDNYKDNIYEYASLLLMKRGQKTEALNYANKINYTLSLGQDLYREMAIILMKRGEKEEALQLVKKISNLTPYRHDHVSTAYKDLCIILYEQGKKREAYALVKEHEIEDKFNRHLVGVLLKCGEKEEALRIASEIKDIYLREWAYEKIVIILIERGDKEEAFSLISRCGQENIYLLKKDIVKALISRGDKTGALSVAKDITNFQMKQISYAYICAFLMNRGEKKEAIKVASSLKDDLPCSSEVPNAYRTIIRALMERGERKEALDLASKINQSSVRLLSFVTICKFLLEKEERQQAETIAEKNKLGDEFYKIFIDWLLEKNETNEALSVASKFSNVHLQKNRTNDINFNKYEIKIRNFMDNGQKEKALELAASIPEKLKYWGEVSCRNLIYYLIAERIIKRNHKTEPNTSH
tara:strand:- start:832 stop:2808 length:1977 start_codon:yes stop_codon:yes gene_type:complete